MRILLLGSKFFGYTSRVCEELRKSNSVSCEYSYSYSKIERILRKIHIKYDHQKIYYGSLVTKYSKEKLDKIIVLGGGFPYSFVSELKLTHPECSLTLYMSADRRSYGFTDEYLALFGRVLTYSLNDAQEFNLEYRPWFFSQQKTSEKLVDISFVGSIHPSRYFILKELYRTSKLRTSYFIYSDILAFLKTFMKWWMLTKHIHFKGLPYDEYIDLLSKSKATLDIPEAEQTNITTRPIESIATETKIITTNKFIRRYDFYHEDNVFIVDQKLDQHTILQIEQWLLKPYVKIPSCIVENYSITTFCNEIVR